MKNGWKKFVIWAAVISTLLGTVIGSQVMAIKTSEALSQMKEAGKIQLVANVFSKCVKQKVEEDASIQYSGGNPSKNFFNSLGGWGEHIEIPTGAWLENQIQGKVNNGTIYCDDNSENLVNLFKSTLGISEKELVCDGDKPGLLVPYFSNGGIRGDKVAKCSDAIGQDGITFWLNTDGAMDHVKKLYNNKKKSNSYLVSWGDRGTFTDDLINYFLYFNDFTTACSKSSPYSGDPDLMNKNNYFEVKVPNPSTGKMEKKYYSNQDIVKNDWDSSWVSKKSGKHTCDGAVERINDTAPAVKKALDKTEKDKDESGNDTTTDDIVGDITDDANNDGGGTQEEASPCSKASGALGWIVCPVVQALGKAADWFYDFIEQSYLQTDVEYVNDTSGTHQAWETFRNLANIAFAIALLVIILSQITGFGVSNYGVKKMLPSLILVAVLVNLSFFLCQIAVDLSNIIGHDIKELFVGISEGVSIGSEYGNGGLGAIIATVVSAALVVGSGIALANTVEFWIMPFVLLLIVGIISILAFFLLLGVRQAAIIILVALSPLAIICYALPNTKNVFNRWWKLFFGMLIVYPICGALMGGGQFASKLLLANANGDSGIFYVFVSVLIQAIPIFFVPTILKSSFQAMGNLGTKLSTFGSRLGHSVTGGIRRSEGYRDRQARLAGHNAQRYINREQNRELGRRRRWLNNVMHPMEGINARMRQGNGRLASMAKSSHNRRSNRAQNAVLAQDLANRDRTDAFTQRHVMELAKDYTDAWENDGTFAEESSAAAKLEEALNELRADSTNVDARARFTSAMHNLNTSDAGRQYVDSVLNGGVRASALAGETSNKGIQWAASAVRNAAGGDYKAKNPNTFKNLNKLASGSYAYNASDIISTHDNDGNTFLANKNYLQEKARDIGAEQLANTDDGYRRMAIEGLRNGNIQGEARNNLIAQAREAMNNENIAVKGDVGRDLNTIANMEYDAPTGGTGSNSSVSTVDNTSIRSMANASQAELNRISASISSGSIGADERAQLANIAEATLNAANNGAVTLTQESAMKLNNIRALDGRTEIPYSLRVQHNSGNSAPVPEGFTENDSGIVIPRNGQNGDLTGSQIRDFERQMRQHNNGGGNNNNGGGIILP